LQLTALFGATLQHVHVRSFDRTTMSLDPLTSITSALKQAHLIPDVLPESFEPSVLFDVLFPNGLEVMMGNTLTPDGTADAPSIVITPLNIPAEQADSTGGDEVMYTLAMIDPDAPTRAEPVYRSFRHWVVRARPRMRVRSLEWWRHSDNRPPPEFWCAGRLEHKVRHNALPPAGPAPCLGHPPL
jgi:hypothetical protein